MKENRLVWLEAVLRVEGGFVNRKDDPGLATNMGITQATLSDWRGEECHAEDVAQITEDEARSIYLSRYWGTMRGDQLPGGLDIYVCDTAVNSGPARAAKLLQELVGTKVDSFVGPKTMEAVRARQPLQLLLDYHAARMDFLMDLSAWDTFGKGWTNRCNRMLALARSRIQARPGLAEAAGSRIIKANTPVAAASTGGLAWAWSEYSPQVVDWLRDFGNDPAALDRLQSGVAYVNGLSIPPMVVTVLGGLLLVSVLGNAATVWWRWRMWKKGEV